MQRFHRLVVVILCLLSILCSGLVQAACEFENCLHVYQNLKSALSESSRDMGDVCDLQQQLLDCRKRASKKCRGDLNYHFFEKLIRDLLERDGVSQSCAQYNVTAGNGGGSKSSGSGQRVKSGRNMTTTYNDRCKSKYAGGAQVTCALFGLTNLKSFSESFEDIGTSSCSLSGAWSMIDTPEFAIQITNKGGLRPLPKEITTTTLVTVIIKSSQCSERKTYQATFDEVPAMFSDGSSSAGTVSIETLRESEHVRIHVPYIATTIDITKQVSGSLLIPSLTVAVILPQEKSSDLSKDPSRLRGLPLCFYGCPKAATIRPRSTDMSEKSIANYCSQNISSPDVSVSSSPTPINVAMCESYQVMKTILPESAAVSQKLTFPGEEAIGMIINEPTESLRQAENSALRSQSAGLFYGYKSIFLCFLFLVCR